MPTPPEDLQTNTVDGAAAFERGRALAEDDDDLDYDGPDLDFEPCGECDECEDGSPQYCDDPQYDEEDDCSCSDPGCPCGGSKLRRAP